MDYANATLCGLPGGQLNRLQNIILDDAARLVTLSASECHMADIINKDKSIHAFFHAIYNNTLIVKLWILFLNEKCQTKIMLLE